MTKPIHRGTQHGTIDGRTGPLPSFRHGRLFASLIGMTLVGSIHVAQAQVLEEHWWQPNGVVRAIVPDPANNVVYIGGTFSHVGPSVPFGVKLDPVTGGPAAGFAHPNAPVRTAVPDGSGGWYIGGAFTQVGGQPRNRLARVNGDGSLHAWNPGADSTVRALAVHGATVYIGGVFSHVGGSARGRIASVDAATGQPTAWAPDATNGEVRALVVSPDGGTVYAGGTFTSASGNTIGGQGRNRIVALDAATGLATAWNPTANNAVNAMALKGDTLYTGGQFTSTGGSTRNRIAALDRTTGQALAWNPNMDDIVHALATDGTVVYAGGEFATVNGNVARNRIAAFPTGAAAATAWNPDANGDVFSIVVDGGLVYAGGAFTLIGGVVRNHITALDPATGGAMPWDPNAGGAVRCIVGGGPLYAGGDYVSMGGVVRRNIAAFDMTTGLPTTWDLPMVTSTGGGAVNAMALGNGVLYAGGTFSRVGDSTRANLAAISTSTGALLGWDADCRVSLNTIALGHGVLYVGGGFGATGGGTNIGNVGRSGLASIDTATAQVTAWNPFVVSPVQNIVTSEDAVYAAGHFTAVDGSPRRYLASFDAITGQLTAWNPDAGTGTSMVGVRVLAQHRGIVYAGGGFNGVGGENRAGLAAIEGTTGMVTPWDPNPSPSPLGLGSTASIAARGDTVYVGGVFTAIGGGIRGRAAALDVVTGLATPWDPDITSTAGGASVHAIAVSGPRIYLGGQFTSSQGVTRGSWAVFRMDIGTHTEAPAPRAPETFHAFPNPSGGPVRLAQVPGAREMVVVDMLGATVLRRPAAPEIDLAALAPGTYVIIVLDQQGIPLARTRVVRE